MRRSFGHYLLEERIAVGGMARVYRARLRGLGGFEKTLVVKQILPELASDPRFVRMFVEEAKAAVRLSHPHIVPVYELGEVDGVYFLAMEYVEGASVQQLLQDGPLPPPAVAHLGVQLADALDYAHGLGLVHRDVTPRNVLVERTGHARLLDFGVAAPLDARVEVFGTPGFMAPEQARGEPVGPAADVFGLGALLYAALAGTPPFPELLGAASATEAEPRRAAEPLPDHLPAAVRQAVERALRLDPDERFARAADLGRPLRAWLASEHPEGVAEALGRRVSEVFERHGLDDEEESKGEGEVEEDARHGPATVPVTGRVRTLATSQLLAEALGEAAGSAPFPERVPRLEELVAAGGKGPRREPDASGASPAAGSTRPIAREERAGGEERAAGRRTARQRLPLVLLLSLSAVVGLLAWGLLRPESPQEGGVARREGPEGTPSNDADGVRSRARPPSRPLADGGWDAAAEDGGRRTEASQPNTGSGSSRRRRDGPDGGSERPLRRAAFLSVSALPWAELRLDGRPFGRTPRRAVKVRAGRHELTLRCPPLGVQERVRIEVGAGQRLHVEADLQRDPPRVVVRSLN